MGTDCLGYSRSCWFSESKTGLVCFVIGRPKLPSIMFAWQVAWVELDGVCVQDRSSARLSTHVHQLCCLKKLNANIPSPDRKIKGCNYVFKENQWFITENILVEEDMVNWLNVLRSILYDHIQIMRNQQGSRKTYLYIHIYFFLGGGVTHEVPKEGATTDWPYWWDEKFWLQKSSQ